VLFEESSHMPHVEEHDRFLAAVEAFLATIDQPAEPTSGMSRPLPGSL
jgi:hypothetical protein